MAQLHVELIFQYIFEGANLVLRRGKFFFFNSWRKFNSSAKHQPQLIATYLAKKKRGGANTVQARKIEWASFWATPNATKPPIKRLP